MSDPVAVFNQASAAVDTEAWDEAASLCDPASLSLFKRELLTRFDAEPEPWTVERLLRFQPDLPREVAEYQVASIARAADPQRMLADELPTVTSMEELRSMTPAAVFAAWLEGQSQRRHVARAAHETHFPAEMFEQALQNALHTPYEMLGTIYDGEDLAHVVFRPEYKTLPPATMDARSGSRIPDDERTALEAQQKAYLQFATLRRGHDGSWRLLAGHRFLGRENSGFFGYDDTAEEETTDE